MKKIIFLFAAFVSLLGTVGCDDDAWTTNPEWEHIYYVGFFKEVTFSDNLNYEIATDGTARWRRNTTAWIVTGSNSISSDIPLQFHSSFTRSYDTVTYLWVTNDGSSALVEGRDYVLLDANGNTLSPADGKYAITWPKAEKAIHNLKIKRLSEAKGVLKVNTLDPGKGTPSVTEDKYIESTLNNRTGDYEVRGLSHDFNKVTVTFN
ncbi:hypothetical protein LJC44_04685 [Parabacteroides sp. OttesenSCG-928-G06]|nr:hypothetical protein [Parabacteroides sp. OttesenSCG-928-G06]